MQREKGKESLREAVKRLDERLWHQLEEAWRLAEAGIQDAQKSRDGHQQGTPHCRAVEENLAALIPDDWKGEQFTATDLFVLSAAAALHDAGKAADSPDDHGHVSMWEIRDRPADFGLDRGQAIAVGWIVRAHNDGNLEALPQEPVSLGVAEVNVRPLAALFKLADALHTDYRRVSRQVVELGDEQAEDNPKTHFRMLVTGWRFDERGRIVLDAVPKDWGDETVIHTGFEMTRRELEPVVPTLQDASFPCELTLHLDETDLEHKAGLEFETERRIEQAFVGMDYFTEADASRFKGRDDDAQALWHRVMAVPLTLLVGDSGVGKTSLIHAGLLPLLHRAGWRTCYTRPFDEPDRFIVRDLWRDLLGGEAPATVAIVETLERAYKAERACKLLVVLDQFEDVIRVPLPEMLDGLRKALVAAQAERFRNLHVLVSYRTDAEATLGPFFQGITGSDRGLPRTYLQPLSHAGARAALETGFAEAQVAVSGPLLDMMADELEAQTPTPGVYPPYVQMVGETLCRLAREKNEPILTGELYHTEGGCREIIGRYLLQRLAEFGEQEEAARRVLVALVRSTGVKGLRSSEELQAETRLDSDLLASLLAKLVDKRMIRHLGSGQYEIVHDHLAQLVDREIVSNEERQLKELREFLDLKARAYTASYSPLQPADMARLYAVRQHITPTDDQLRLLLHSCLLEQGPAWFWLRDAQATRYLPLLRDALSCPIPLLRRNTTPIIAQVAGREAIPNLRELLKDENTEVWKAAAQTLAQVLQQIGQEAIPDLRKLLKDENADVWETAQALAQVLQQMGWGAAPGLRELLKDWHPEIHRAAAQALAQLLQQMGQEAIPDLREFLKDQDSHVRKAAAQALTQVVAREAIPDLCELLDDQHPEVREAAVQALAQAAARDTISYLRKLLKDQHPEVRKAAVQALAQVAGRDTISDLRKLLKDQDWGVRFAAGQALAQVLQQIGREAIPNLRKLLNARNWEVQWAAAQALTQILQQMGQEAIPDLRELLNEENSVVRGEAALALAQVAGREAIPDLQELLKDEDENIWRTAVKALEELVTEDDLKWLSEWVVRYPLSETGEAANRLFIHLDRKLYCPFDWPEM